LMNCTKVNTMKMISATNINR